MKKLFIDESGQGMTEYILIVAVIAVAAIAVITLFGEQIGTAFTTARGRIAGATR